MTPKTAARTKATIIKTVEIERITPGTFLDQNGTWENENVRVHVEPRASQLFSFSAFGFVLKFLDLMLQFSLNTII